MDYTGVAYFLANKLLNLGYSKLVVVPMDDDAPFQDYPEDDKLVVSFMKSDLSNVTITSYRDKISAVISFDETHGKLKCSLIGDEDLAAKWTIAMK